MALVLCLYGSVVPSRVPKEGDQARTDSRTASEPRSFAIAPGLLLGLGVSVCVVCVCVHSR